MVKSKIDANNGKNLISQNSMKIADVKVVNAAANILGPMCIKAFFVLLLRSTIPGIRE
jgi:hypothetical protein